LHQQPLDALQLHTENGDANAESAL